MTRTCRVSLFLLILFLLPFFQAVAAVADNYLHLPDAGQDNRGLGHLLGVCLSNSEQASFTREDLEKLNELGFSILELEQEALSGYLAGNPDFSRSRLHLFIRQSRFYTTPFELAENDSLYLQQDLTLIRNNMQSPEARAAAFGLFTYPDDQDPASVQLLNRHAEKIRATLGEELILYYHSAWADTGTGTAAYSFHSARVAETPPKSDLPEVVHFVPSDKTLRSLSGLKKLLEISLQSDDSIILIPWSWLAHQLESFEPLEAALKNYTLKGEVYFPEPHLPEPAPAAGWIVLLFMLLLGSYLIHYRFNLSYRNSLLRYFLNHRYFVENTVEYRFRTYLTGGILFFQHVTLTGILAWVFASSSLSPNGYQALQFHFPSLAFFFSGPGGFFLLGFLAALLFQSLSVLWIHFFSRRTRFSQTLALYGWPLHINLLIVFLMMVLSQSGSSPYWIHLFSLLFLMVWFFSFSMAAIDIARLLRRYKALYLLITAGVHTLLAVFLTALVLFYDPLSQSLRFALSLP